MSNEERPQIKWEWARKSKWATAMAMGMGIGMGIKFSHVPVVDYEVLGSLYQPVWSIPDQ